MTSLEGMIAYTRCRRDLPPPALRRALREAAGLSLSHVAAVVGVTRQCVSKWERGERNPRGVHLREYVDLLRALQNEAQ